MKYPLAKALNQFSTARVLLIAVCVFAGTLTTLGQKKGDIVLAPEAIGVNIEQCANGPISAPINCNVSSANDGYTRGNLIASKSHYLEGDFVPIRIVADGLTIGQQYTVTIGYDYTKGGKYANDYLGDYDYTESVNNDPCVGVTGCTLASEQNIGVPIDPQVTAGFDGIAGTSDDITQISGSFSCFGCTFNSVSGYTLSGSTTGDSTKSITLTFTANATSVVIAYGSHISTRADWGNANSAINISGSPYHNYIVAFPGANSGNRDLQLSAEAVIFPATITITKLVANSPAFRSVQSFLFNVAPTVAATSQFSLTDSDAGQFVGGVQVISGITLFETDIVVTESQIAAWTLSDLTCSISAGGGSTTGTVTFNQTARTATFNLREGNTAACTFTNLQVSPTAAPASVAGRVVNSDGIGIGGARILVTNSGDGSTKYALSNPFGYYSVDDLAVGEFYVVSVSHKRYSFTDNTRTFTLNDSVADVDFVANP